MDKFTGLDGLEYIIETCYPPLSNTRVQRVVLVPKEPTKAMLEAGRQAWPDSSGIAPAVWRAMIEEYLHPRMAFLNDEGDKP